MENIKKYEDIALSDKEVLALIDGKANRVLYPELVNYKNIDEVLGPYGACILLFEAKKNYGHWVCLFKMPGGGKIEFFNPYGGFPDDSLKYIPSAFAKISNQDFPYLSALLYESPYELYYNEHKFQKKDSSTKTCGRWCAVRLSLRDYSLEEFTELFIKNGDEIVTILTMYINM